jgi:hypothetical protein
MLRGSRPGERRDGRKQGMPNRRTILRDRIHRDSTCGGLQAKRYDSLNELWLNLVCGTHNARHHRCRSVRALLFHDGRFS